MRHWWEGTALFAVGAGLQLIAVGPSSPWFWGPLLMLPPVLCYGLLWRDGRRFEQERLRRERLGYDDGGWHLSPETAERCEQERLEEATGEMYVVSRCPKCGTVGYAETLCLGCGEDWHPLWKNGAPA